MWKITNEQATVEQAAVFQGNVKMEPAHKMAMRT